MRTSDDPDRLTDAATSAGWSWVEYAVQADPPAEDAARAQIQEYVAKIPPYDFQELVGALLTGHGLPRRMDRSAGS